MKRFFCKKCNRVRRARSYPMDVALVESVSPEFDGLVPAATKVTERSGTCWRHGDGRPMGRKKRIARPAPKTVMAAAINNAKKGKR